MKLSFGSAALFALLAAASFLLFAAPAKAAPCLVSAGCTGQTSFTTNALIFQGSDPLRFSGSSNLTWNGSTLSVIGTASSSLFAAYPGSAGNPSYTFSGATDSGFYIDPATSPKTIYVETSGNHAFRFNSNTNISYAPIIGLNSKTFLLRADAGAVGTPTYAFNNDADTGVWSSAADTLNLAAGGIDIMTIRTSGASTTAASIFSRLSVGGTATTTIDSTGNITIPSGSGLTNTGRSDGCASWSSGLLTSTGIACGSGTGTGLSTSSPIAAGNVLTYSATGAGSAYGTATSTFTPNSDFSTTGTIGTFVGGSASTLALNMATAHSWSGLQTFANASSTLASFGYASSTVWRGGGLTTDCDTAATSKLLWDITTGQFSCGTDQTGSSFAWPWTAVNVYGSVNQSTTSPMQFQGAINASSTVRIKTNLLSTHNLGFFDLQRDAQTSGNGYTLMRIKAPTGASQESTLSLVIDYDNNNAGVNERFIDFYTEHYADSDQSGIRIFQTGTAGLGNSFMFGWKLEAGSKDSQNVGGFFPNGGWLIGGPATTTQSADTLLTVSSTTAGTLLDVKDGVGASRLTVSGTGFGTTTLSGLTISGSATSTSNVGFNITTGCYAINGTCLSTGGSGITALGPAGQTQTGATQTLATSTGSFNGLTLGITIVGNSNTQTFTPSLSGTLGVAGGGTGVGTFTSSQLLYGNGTNALSSVATTSLTASGVVSLSNPISVIGGAASAITITGGTNGQVLGWLGGVPTWTATSSVAASTGISISAAGSVSTITNTGVISNSCPGGFLTCSGTNPSSFSLGTLTVANGGTGTTTNRYGGIFFGDGSIFRQASTTGLLDYDPTSQIFTVKFASTTAISGTNSTWSGIVQAATGIFTSILRIPNGSAPTVATDGDIGIDTTSNQFKYQSNSATRVLGDGNFYPAFTVSTTTAWTGTTTMALGPAYTGETWNGLKCFTDTGTLNVSFYDGTNRMNLVNASTTVGTNTLSTNNTFTAGEKRYVDIGTPASSPTYVSCTVSKSITAD